MLETLGLYLGITSASSVPTVWPSGLRRQTQVLVEQSAWVRTPQLSIIADGTQRWEEEVLGGFEPPSLDSESRVLTVTPQDQLER